MMKNEKNRMTAWLAGCLMAALTVTVSATATAPASAAGPGELKFGQASFEVIEENGVAVITVERSRGEDGTVSVDYSTADGSATAGSDYTGASGTFTWGNGDGGDRTFQIPILDDPEAEGPETIELTLSNPTGGAILDPERGTSVAIILASDGGGNPPPAGGGGNEPGVLKFDEESFEVLEEAGMATVLVERSQGEAGAASVDYSATAGTATAGLDFTEVSGTLFWADGDGTNRTFQVPILDDPEAEGAETIELTLSNATGAAIDPLRGTSVVVILASDGGGGGGGGNPPPPPGGNNPDAGVLKFDERNFGAVEGNGLALIVVERSQGETGAVTVDYAASAGTATAGGDFTAVSGTLSWASGDGASKTFTVPLIDDPVAEGNETVMLTLSNPTGGAGIDAERGTAVLIIFDDDAGNPPAPPGNPNGIPGTIRFDETSFEVIEGGEAVIVVERSQGEGGTVSVDYTTVDGSATAGSDYTPASGTLTWGPGDGSDKTFVVPLLEDVLSEGNETVQLVLSNATGGASIDPVRGESTLVILDNDGSTLACVPSATTMCLAAGRFQVEVDWRTRQGTHGDGRMTPLAGGRSGLVWFFNPTNVEMLVKVIDACQQFDRYWVFFSATTNVDYTVTVTDTDTGIVRQYSNPLGRPAEPVQDTFTFATCN